MSVHPNPVGLRRLSAVSLAGASLLLSAALASVFLRTMAEAWRSGAAAGPASPADGILLLVGLAGTLLTLWLGLGTALSALSALPGTLGRSCRDLAARVAPATVRKGVAFVLGTSLTAAFIPGTAVAELSHETRAGIVATGSAGSREVAGSTQGSTTGRTAEGTGGNTAGGTTGATAGGTTGATAGNTRVVRVVGGRVVGGAGRVSLAEGAPDASFRFVAERHAPGERPDGARTGDAAPSPQWSLDGTDGTVVDEHQIVVLRGDTLWSIAAAHLGPAAGAAVIDAEWRRWFALNREVIGKNADQILPGQLLTPPVSIQKASRTQAPGSEPSFAVGAGS